MAIAKVGDCAGLVYVSVGGFDCPCRFLSFLFLFFLKHNPSSDLLTFLYYCVYVSELVTTDKSHIWLKSLCYQVSYLDMVTSFLAILFLTRTWKLYPWVGARLMSLLFWADENTIVTCNSVKPLLRPWASSTYDWNPVLFMRATVPGGLAPQRARRQDWGFC